MNKKRKRVTFANFAERAQVRINPDLDKIDTSEWFKKEMEIGEEILKKAGIPVHPVMKTLKSQKR